MAGGANSLPKTFDAIILGTGMPESILAAGLSRIGRSVLHLDRNPYYGSDSTTFSFSALLKWGDALDDQSEKLTVKDITSNLLEEREKTFPLSINSLSVSGISSYHSTVSEDERKLCEKILREEACRLEAKYKPSTSDSATTTTTAPLAGASATSSNSACDTSENIPTAQSENFHTQADQTAESMTTCENTCEDKQQIISGDDSTEEQGEDQTVKSIPHKDQPQTAKSSDREEPDCDKGAMENCVNPIVKCYVCAKLEDPNLDDRSAKLKFFLEHSRKFNLDLCPKVLYSRSALIDLLISSDVARYCEFRSISLILTHRDGKLEKVPCSRSDIFSTKAISMIEKRMLMKFLTLCSDQDLVSQDLQGAEQQSFADFLKFKKLNNNLVHYVQNSIAMIPGNASAIEGVRRTQKFIQSLGRYGPTSFLWPLYGGEITQSFCRMSAVFGGCYILQRTAQCIIEKDGRACGIVCNENERITCQYVIMNADYAKLTHTESQSYYISRAIIITCGALMDSEKEEATLLSIPNLIDENDDPVTVIELGAASAVCPLTPYNLRVCHMTSGSSRNPKSAEERLKPYMDLIFTTGEQDSSKPRVMFAMFFNQLDHSKLALPQVPAGVHFTLGPDSELDYDKAVHKAREIFEQICPGEEFLPKPPNPEDIIYCDNTNKTASDDQQFTGHGSSGDCKDQSTDQFNSQKSETDITH